MPHWVSCLWMPALGIEALETLPLWDIVPSDITPCGSVPRNQHFSLFSLTSYAGPPKHVLPQWDTGVPPPYPRENPGDSSCNYKEMGTHTSVPRAVSPSQRLSSPLYREGDHHPLTSTGLRDDGGPRGCSTPRAPQGPVDPQLLEDISMFSCCFLHKLGVPRRRMGGQVPFQPCRHRHLP